MINVDGVATPLNVAGFNKVYEGGNENFDTNVIKLVYDDNGSVAYAQGDITGQFLGVSAADSGNANQPRAIIGEWKITGARYVVDTITTTALMALLRRC